MALSFEQSKNQISQTQPSVMSLSNDTPEEVYEPIKDRYKWYEEYEDTNISEITAEKNISVNASQINLTQEVNSQYIPFRMNRYYDGIDLKDMNLQIHYVNSRGFEDISVPVNVMYSDTKIQFAWLVGPNETAITGEIKFEIIATGVNEKGENYVWKTRPNGKLNVLESLAGNGIIEPSQDWYNQFVADMNQQVGEAKKAAEDAEAAATEARNAATEIKDSIDTIVSEQLNGAIDTALENYYTKDEVDTKIANIDITKQLTDTNNKVAANTSAIEGINTDIAAIESEIGEINTDIGTIKTDIENANTAIDDVDAKFADYDNSTEVDEKIDAAKTSVKDDVTVTLGDYYTKTEVDKAIEEIDITSKLDGVNSRITNVESQFTNYDTSTQVDEKITTAISGVNSTINEYKESNDTRVDKLEQDMASIDTGVGSRVDALQIQVTTNTNDITTIKSDVATNKSSIDGLNASVKTINEQLAGIDDTPGYTYEATYGEVTNDDGTTQEYMFTLWETEGNKEPTVKSRFQIMGGGGGIGSGVTLRIAYVEGYTTPIVATVNDKAIIKYEFSGEDSAGDTNLDGTASWKVGNRVVATEDIATGVHEFDITDYVSIGDNKVLLTITHATGAIATKSWTVKVVDVRLTSTFDDTRKYTAGEQVSFAFTPYGGVNKTVHFLLDGEEIDTKTSSAAAAGLSDSYMIPAQAHGTHLFEIYLTAVVNNNTIESNHIVKDIIWYDENSNVPVISCVDQTFTARQYEAKNIIYTVYDPNTETPNVNLRATYVNEDGETVDEFNSNLVMNKNTETWQYKTDVIGEHTLTITCGETVKTLVATITELGINVSPITAGLAFDFNPVGYSNSDENRLWSSGDVVMSVSENFDWVNGGYQLDENGDQCFCIKAGTSAEINYELFGDDAKTNGKQMKLIFKTENVADADTTFMSCVSTSSAGDQIGIVMKAHEATIYASADKDKLPLPYAEEEIIEFEFNITPSTESPSMVMGYEDGVSTRPFVYNSTHNFQQQAGSRKTITLGSPDCDLYIYRFKVYKNSLSDRDILNNFIADARSAEEMIARYERNQIYKEGLLDPDYLAEVCPQLRIIKLEVPYFTSDKDEKIGRFTSSTGVELISSAECIYKNGDPVLDNWVATDIVHSGQGTSSNNYGPSGRNLDIIIKRYRDKKTNQYLNESPIITLSDGTEVSEVSLTRNSVDVNYFNVKVNIASSENANNALLAKRFNTYQPYSRPVVRDTEEEAAKVKDTMEFQNCVIFVKESDPDLTTHREFNDNNWHFYAIGNIGDSKKTDDSRLTDPSDPYECILEVMDNTLPNSTMPTGVVDEKGNPVYPIAPEQWVAGNSAYDALYADLFDESKPEDKENGLEDTYGWRYIYEDGTDEQNAEYRAYVENKWREFYTFVVTATDEEFKAHLGDYCVLNSMLYYYLFTLRYTMTDNHGKNSFFHYGKTGEVDEDGNPIRKWDLCFGYDFDKN